MRKLFAVAALSCWRAPPRRLSTRFEYGGRYHPHRSGSVERFRSQASTTMPGGAAKRPRNDQDSRPPRANRRLSRPKSIRRRPIQARHPLRRQQNRLPRRQVLRPSLQPPRRALRPRRISSLPTPPAASGHAGSSRVRRPPPGPGTAPVVRDGSAAAQRRCPDHGAPPHRANSPLGVWLTGREESKGRIEQCGANLCGYSVDAKSNQNGETGLDQHEARPGQMDRAHLRPNSGGHLRTPRSRSKGSDSLRVQGCAFGGMFCGGQTWSRLN